MALAQAMMAGGMQGQAKSPLDVAGNVLKTYLGATAMKEGEQDLKNRQEAARKTLAEAMTAYRGGQPIVQDPSTVQPPMRPQVTMSPRNNREALLNTMMGNPDTAGLASQLQLEEAFRPPITPTYKASPDPNSPSGLSYQPVRPGLPAAPPSGTSIRVGPDGQLVFEQGPGVTGMDKKLVNTVQDKQFKAQESLQRLEGIRQTYKPEYSTIGTRTGFAWDSLKAKWNSGDLAPEQVSELNDYATWRSSSVENLNRYINDLSGAAVSAQEAVRMQAALPNAGTGIFDGDDPVTYTAKLNRVLSDAKIAIARYNYAMRNGADWKQMPLYDMKKVINQRGTEIEQQLKDQGLTGENLKASVRDVLNQEFYGQ